MEGVRDQALRLRLQGRSYNEINQELGIPKSTLSGWFSSVRLSVPAQQRLASRVAQGTLNGLVKRNKLQTRLARDRARITRQIAKAEIGKLSKRERWLIGIALYWAEGYKKAIVRNGKEITSHIICFTNSDARMVRGFVRFLRFFMEVSKEDITLELRLFDPLQEQVAIRFWKNITGLEDDNFTHISYVISRSSLRKRPFNQLPFGTIQVRVSSTEKFHKLMGWIEGVAGSK